MINFEDFPDYPDWSDHWVNLLSSFASIEEINQTDELKSQVRELILNYDRRVWNSYRSGSMEDISYEDKYFQLAYLFRYYPLYANTLSYINGEESYEHNIDMLDDCFVHLKNATGLDKQKIKINISIFGGGSAPEAYAITKMICAKLRSGLWNFEYKLSECELHFSIFDKDDWNIGRIHTKKLLRDFKKELELDLRGINGFEKLRIIFEEKKFNIKSDTPNFSEKQDFMIFQFCLTEFRDLIGPEKLTNFIEQMSDFLNQGGKLVLLERSHYSTPKDFFGLFEETSKLELLFNSGPIAQLAQNYSEIPSFVMSAYSESGINLPKFNRFEYFIFKQESTKAKIQDAVYADNNIEVEETINETNIDYSHIRIPNIETGDKISVDGFGKGTVLKRVEKNANIQVYFDQKGIVGFSIPYPEISIIKKWWEHIDPNPYNPDPFNDEEK